MSEQAGAGGGSGGPLFRGGPAGLLPRCVAPCPQRLLQRLAEQSWRSRLERRAVVPEPRGRRRQEDHTVSSGATEPEARAGRAGVLSTAQHARPQRAAPGGLKPGRVCQGPAGVRGQRQEEDEEQPRRAAWKRQQSANGAKTRAPRTKQQRCWVGDGGGALASAPSQGSG